MKHLKSFIFYLQNDAQHISQLFFQFFSNNKNSNTFWFNLVPEISKQFHVTLFKVFDQKPVIKKYYLTKSFNYFRRFLISPDFENV